MELILAEKPSAARNFAKALGGKTGSYAGTEYKITNLRGHVMGLAGCISHGLDADVIKKSGDLFATARAMLLDACVCLLYRQGGDSMSMQGLVDLLQNDISHNEDQDMPSIKAAYDKIEADGATVEEDLGLKRYRMFQAIAYGETAISVELDLYAKLSLWSIGRLSARPASRIDMPAIRMAMRYSCGA